jgi:hypothetical protein
MSINILKYQPVVFRTTQEIEQENCECSDKPFCQLVNKNDATQWQLLSTNLVVNGTFDTTLDDWNIQESLIVTVQITNESAEGECNGELVVTATGGTGPYEYSKDGTTFQVSDTFEDLCADCYTIVVRDSLGNLGFATACVDTNVDCSLYNSPDLFDLSDTYLSQLINCELNDLA